MEIYSKIRKLRNPILTLFTKILYKYKPTEFYYNILIYYLDPNKSLNLELKPFSKISVKLVCNYDNGGEFREYFRKNNLNLNYNYYAINIEEYHNIKGERGRKNCIDNIYLLEHNKENRQKLLKLLDYLLGEFK